MIVMKNIFLKFSFNIIKIYITFTMIIGNLEKGEYDKGDICYTK